MRNLTLPTLAVALLTAVLASTGLFAVRNLDYTLARYPGAASLGDGHFDLRSALRGYVNQNDTYQTGDNVASVRRWYARHLNVEPAPNIPMQGQCVALEGDQRLIFRRAVRVSLCSTPHRTLIFVNQVVYFSP
jgi:hypothetical protein